LSNAANNTVMQNARELVADEFTAVNQLIIKQLSSDVILINQISQHIIHSGGKRLRPLLVLLAAKACGYQGNTHIPAAAIIEFIHTATLLHDDVVDESDLRRGEPTANNLFGNAASVLVGDFLYSRSFQMMVEMNNMDILRILADATNRIAEGEVLQLLNIQNADTTEKEYLDVIDRKTATLFAAGTEIAGVLNNLEPIKRKALADFGTNLGFAFQIVDDLLDYQADENDLGKSLGDDLEEGKPTLPIIRTLQTCSPSDKNFIRSALESDGRDSIDTVLKIMQNTDALDYTAKMAQDYAAKAKNCLKSLPDSNYLRSLAELADFSVSRTY